MIIHIEKNTDDTYIARFYGSPNTLRYISYIPISYRGNNEWEVHLWVSIHKLWDINKYGPPPSYADMLIEIYRQLKNNSDRFNKLIATVELDRVKLYERLFRNYFELVPIRDIVKTYNGMLLEGVVLEIKPKEGVL